MAVRLGRRFIPAGLDFYEDIYFKNADEGFVVGWQQSGQHLILRTTNGGSSWTTFNPSFPGTVGVGFLTIDFATDDIGFAAGADGNWVKTTDGGATWTENSHTTFGRSFIDVEFFNENIGVLLNESTLQFYTTTNGGATWTKRRPPSSLGGLRTRIQYFDTQIAYAYGDGIIYSTSDNGVTWSFQGSLPSDARTYFFTDLMNGYVADRDGNIFQTIDGGETWFLQNETGLVLPSQMRFTDANNGWIAGGNFGEGGIFKTQNAGGLAVNWQIPNGSICPGDTLILDCEHLGGQTFNWTLDGSQIGSGLPLIYVPQESGDYEIGLEIRNATHSKTFTRNLLVQGTNVPIFSAKAVDTVCINEPVVFNFFSENNGFELTIKSNGQDLTKEFVRRNDTLEWTSPPLTEAQTFEFFKDEFGCDSYFISSKMVRVVQPPKTDLAVNFLTNPVCENGFAEVKISNAESRIFYEIFANGISQNQKIRPASNGDFVLPTLPVTDVAAIEVKATASQACYRIMDKKLDLEIMFVDPEFAPFTENLALNDALILSNNSSDTLNFDWKLGTGSSPAQSSDFDPRPVRYSSVGEKEIQLIGISPRGCRDTNFQKITVYDSSNLSDEWAISHNTDQGVFNQGLFALDADFYVFSVTGGRLGLDLEIGTKAGKGQDLNFEGELLFKHDQLGVLQWSVPISIEKNDPDDDGTLSITNLTTVGNDVFVTGMVNENFNGKAIFGSRTGEPIEVVENHFVFVAKYNASGKLLWVNRITSLFENNCSSQNAIVASISLRANGAGDLFLAARKLRNRCPGWMFYDASGDSTRITSVGTERETIFKISDDGDLIWSTPFQFSVSSPANQNVQIACLEPDNNGGLAVLSEGYSTSSNDDASRAGHISKFDANGNFQWEYAATAERWAGTHFIYGKDLTIDDEGNIYALLSTHGAIQFIPARRSTVYERVLLKLSPSGEFKYVRYMQHHRPNVRHARAYGLDYDEGLVYVKTFGSLDSFGATPICFPEISAGNMYISVWDTLGNLVQVMPNNAGSDTGSENQGTKRTLIVREGEIFTTGEIQQQGGEIDGLPLLSGKNGYLTRFRKPKEFIPYITLPWLNFNGCGFSRCENDEENVMSVSPIFENLEWYRDGNPTALTNWQIKPPVSGDYHAEGINPLGEMVESPQQTSVTVNPLPVIAVQATATQIVVNLIPGAFYSLLDDRGFPVEGGFDMNIFEPTEPGIYTVRVAVNTCTTEEQIAFPGDDNLIDMDMDGFFSDSDCDDMNPDINPGAVEIPNNDIDEDCDGIAQIIDEDMDGFNSDEDCDDFNPDANPAADEIPNNDVDEDCDGELWIIDEDMDGFNSDEDCDDADPDVNPDASEIPNNDVDEDCDGIAQVIDEDMDGFNSDEDCDDDNPNINPDALEIPDNGIDEDCDGIDATSSARDLAFKNSIKVFPNPISDVLRIQLEQPIFVKISVFDALGVEILEVTPISKRKDFEIDLSGQVSGFYVLKVEDLSSGSVGQLGVVKQ